MVDKYSRFFALGSSTYGLAHVLAVVLAVSLPGCSDSDEKQDGDTESHGSIVPPAELTSDISDQRRNELVELGRSAFTARGCVSCHSIDGQALTGPPLAGIYGLSISLEDGRVLERDMTYLYQSLIAPSQYISAGGSVVMPPYMYLDEQTLVSLVYFVRSLSDPEANTTETSAD